MALPGPPEVSVVHSRAVRLTNRELNRATLARQMLLTRERVSSVDVVERLCGMQAQVPKPPFIGLWTRIEDFQREELSKAIAKHEVVRGTLMRGTIHLVSRADYLTWRNTIQPVLTRIASSLTKDAYEPEPLCALARKFFDEQPRTFEELREILPKGDERLQAYLIRMHLPLVMVPDDSTWSYAANSAFAVAETVLRRKLKAADPKALAMRYLAAFGPASAKDFERWSGLTGGRALFDELRSQLEVFTDERKRELFDIPDAPRPPADIDAPLRFLPEFDNILLAHDDRSRIISAEHQPRVATKNLRILGTFLVDGFVAGIWSSTRKGKKATLTLEPFGKLDKKTTKALNDEADRLLRFIEPDASSFALA